MTHNQYPPSLVSEQQATLPQELEGLEGLSELTDKQLAEVTGAFGPHPGWGYGYGGGWGHGYGYGGGWGHGYGYGYGHGHGYGYGGGWGHGWH